MNIILIEDKVDRLQLKTDDPRIEHLRSVLKMQPGGTVYVGCLNGPRGLATLHTVEKEEWFFTIEWESQVPELQPLTLMLGLPRPQTAKAVLREGACLGFEKIVFFQSDKGEPSYAQSRLWQGEEWETLLKQGAAQAFNTRIPEVLHYPSLLEALQAEGGGFETRVALDLYQAKGSLADLEVGWPALLLIGSERGWSEGERQVIDSEGIEFCHMGDRVLRTETACVASASIMLASGQRLGAGWGQSL